MIGNIQTAAGKANTISAHFVHQILPEYNDFLCAVLNPTRDMNECSSV